MSMFKISGLQRLRTVSLGEAKIVFELLVQ